MRQGNDHEKRQLAWPRLASIAACGLLALAVAACGGHGEDTSLYVSNGSDSLWLLRVEHGGMVQVATITPGAEGLALAWIGGSTVPVDVLDGACDVVGTFEADASGVYRVAAVPGLTATILDKRPGLFPKWSPGAKFTTECGGMFYPD